MEYGKIGRRRRILLSQWREKERYVERREKNKMVGLMRYLLFI